MKLSIIAFLPHLTTRKHPYFKSMVHFIRLRAKSYTSKYNRVHKGKVVQQLRMGMRMGM